MISGGFLDDPFMLFFSQMPWISLGKSLIQRCSLLSSQGVARQRKSESVDRPTLRKMLIDDINASDQRGLGRIALAFAQREIRFTLDSISELGTNMPFQTTFQSRATHLPWMSPPARPHCFHLILEKVTSWQLSIRNHDASCSERGATKVRGRAKRVPGKGGSNRKTNEMSQSEVQQPGGSERQEKNKK